MPHWAFRTRGPMACLASCGVLGQRYSPSLSSNADRCISERFQRRLMMCSVLKWAGMLDLGFVSGQGTKNTFLTLYKGLV